jgi:hypothetical protein
LVDLFGKKSQERTEQLQSSLLELQKERDELRQILARRDEKIKKLTSANQEANIALKALESRPSPGKPDQGAGKAESKETSPERGKTCAVKMTPSEASILLQRLSGIKSQKDDLLTAYLINPGSAAEKSLPSDIQCLASSIRPGRGMAAFQCPGLFSLALVPPLPLSEDVIDFDDVFHPQTLQDMMETPLLVVSAHAGETFIGVALSKEGFELQEMVESQVKEKHSKGGWSQKRFERLREEDIRGHSQAVEERLHEILARYRPVLKYAVIGGDQILLKQIAPDMNLPKVERSLDKPDEKHIKSLLDDVYGFTLCRS